MDNKKKSVRKYEREAGGEEPLAKHSGKLPKGARPSEPPTLRPSTRLPDESQLRRRVSLDTQMDSARSGGSGAFAKRRQNTKPIPLPDPGPGFVLHEPEGDSGVPTPRPRLPMSLVPKKLMDDRKVIGLPLDHRAGFVLAHIDGVTNIRTMTDVCGMTQDELSEVVERLVELKVIKLT